MESQGTMLPASVSKGLNILRKTLFSHGLVGGELLSVLGGEGK